MDGGLPVLRELLSLPAYACRYSYGARWPVYPFADYETLQELPGQYGDVHTVTKYPLEGIYHPTEEAIPTEPPPLIKRRVFPFYVLLPQEVVGRFLGTGGKKLEKDQREAPRISDFPVQLPTARV